MNRRLSRRPVGAKNAKISIYLLIIDQREINIEVPPRQFRNGGEFLPLAERR